MIFTQRLPSDFPDYEGMGFHHREDWARFSPLGSIQEHDVPVEEQGTVTTKADWQSFRFAVPPASSGIHNAKSVNSAWSSIVAAG